MYEVKLTVKFRSWLSDLRDVNGKARILARLKAASAGNLGDWKSVGDGLSEMRVQTGPGYRLYFARSGQTIVIILVGGNKASQSRDIGIAKQMMKEMEGD